MQIRPFEAIFKTESQKIELIQINVIFVNGIQWLTFTEKNREIGEGPQFALSVLTWTAS